MRMIIIISLLALLSNCSTAPGNKDDSGGTQSGDPDAAKMIQGAKLPPTVKSARSYPKLVNYFHMDLPESHIANVEERLAQWDIIILYPDDVISRGISLSKIRAANPGIKILAWIPVGQEPAHNSPYGVGIPPETDTHNWYGKTIGGAFIKPPWGGHMMNPYKESYAWPKYIINVITNNYLDNNLYDGILFDILAEGAPTFTSPDTPQTFDVDENGTFDATDNAKYKEGFTYLLQILRQKYGSAKIFTGNGGVPWMTGSPYFEYANGNMHECCLGNELGNDYWYNNFTYEYGAWDGYRAVDEAVSASYPSLPRYHFLSVDLRLNRSQNEAQNQTALTADDMRRFRMGLATSMLKDSGYFGFDRGDCLHGQIWWFDEYDINMGSPKEAFQSGVYGTQTYSREFDNGIVIVNNNSSPVTVTLPYTCKDVSAKASGTSFTIPSYDGGIYLKQ